MSKNTEWKTIRVSDNTDMRVFCAWPEGNKKKVPGILILQEAFGVNDHIQDVTQRIATLGYVAVAPELYHRTQPGFKGDYENSDASMQQMKAVTDKGLEADLKAAYDFITGDEYVDNSRIGAVGYCMGGRTAFLANAVLPLKAAVSYYGARIAPDLLSRAKDQHGPILLFWGGLDKRIGHEQPVAVAGALRDAQKLFVSTEFSNAEHGFFCDVRKSYSPIAAKESWALFTQFFADHLNAV